MRSGAQHRSVVQGKRTSGPVSSQPRAKPLWYPRGKKAHKRERAPLGTTQVIRHRADVPEENERPTTPASAMRARLAWGLRPFQRKRVALCRTVRTAPEVQLVGRVSPDGTGRLVIQGVSTCGSVHSCPCCVAPILTARSEELQSALDANGRGNTAIATFTLRHHMGIPLRVLRTLLGRAYSEMFAGKAGQALRARLRLRGHVRSAEQTYGGNGWHPHLHCLMFFEAEPDGDWESDLTDRWLTVVRQVYGRMLDTCRACERLEPLDSEAVETLTRKVQRVLGAWVSNPREGTTLTDRAREFRRGLEKMGGVEGVMPDTEHAVVAEMCTNGAASRYLAKMGCELTGVMGKEAKPGHWTHWQLARLAADGEAWAQRLWVEHAGAMLGARQLTWSRGLRKALGLAPERPDSVLAAETISEPGDVDTPLASLDGALWDLFARQQRQLWVADLHQAYADGTLEVTLEGPSRPVNPPPEPVPVWWERNEQLERARRKGAGEFKAMTDAAEEREDRKGRAYLSKAEREELRDELRHHLKFDHGLGLRPSGEQGPESWR